MDLSKIIESFGGGTLGILFFAIIFIFKFNKEIANLIKNLKSVSKDGFTIKQTPESQNENRETETIDDIDDLLGKKNSVVIESQKQLIKDDLKKRNLTIEDNDTTNILIYQLSVTQIELNFERIYTSIFGSQIFLLKKLNEVSGQGKTKEDINIYFLDLKSKNAGFENWELDDYLAFLFSVDLIIITDNNYHITYKGYEFLLWLIKMKYNENKPL